MGGHDDERRAGLIEDIRRPRDTAVTTFAAFNAVGLIPLLPFVAMFVIGSSVVSAAGAFTYSVIFTAAAFFLIGSVKGKVVQKPLPRSGLNTLLVGGIAAAVAFAVGYVLNLIVH